MSALPPNIQAKVDELSRLARDVRKASGLSVGEVAAATHNERTVLTRINSGGWIKHGLSRHALQASFRAMGADEAVLGQATSLYDEIDEWRRARHPTGTRGDVSAGERHRLVRWGAAVSQPPGRPYASLDRLILDVDGHGRVDGTIERVEPETRRGAAWTLVGYLTNRSLHLTFWPAPTRSDDGPQSDSIGHIAVQRQPSRTMPWPGYFTKLERREGKTPRLNQFKYALCPPNDLSPLLHTVSSVAILDFDNTLASGWIMDSWIALLARKGVGRAGDAFERLQQLFDEYRGSDSFGHDQLASAAAETYAWALAGVRVDEVTRHAASFVADYLSDRQARLFKSAKLLLTGLRERGLRPILISGAPKEVVDRLMRELDISTSFPLLLHQDGGRYTGEIDFNHGLASVKAEACDILMERDCDLVVAIGDSEGDRPMWKRARCSVRVGQDTVPAGVTIDGVDLSQPLSPEFWTRIPRASWLDELVHDG